MEFKAISLDRAYGVMDGISFILDIYGLIDDDSNVETTKKLFQEFCEVYGIDFVSE